MCSSIMVISVIIISNFIFIANAYAYIDPNTGGFFFQTVAPFVYGILGLIVVFWKKIAGFVRGLFGSKKISDNSDKN